MREFRTYRIILTMGLFAATAPAITIGHVDTFEDGTTMGWQTGMGLTFTPLNIASGGPSGANDNYLQLTATGLAGQPGGKMVAFTSSPNWTGDFLGVPAIQMDVNNFGPADLELRLLFEDFDGPGPPVNLALSTESISVPSGSGWVRVTFRIDPGSLTAPLGDAATALANTDALRIFHNPDPVFQGPPASIPDVNAVLGIDNIAAVPEPGSLALLGLGLGALALARRRRTATRRELLP